MSVQLPVSMIPLVGRAASSGERQGRADHRAQLRGIAPERGNRIAAIDAYPPPQLRRRAPRLIAAHGTPPHS